MNHYLVITGGSRGIGEATIKQFTEHQWKVINISRNACLVPGVKNFSIDLSKPEHIERFATPLAESVADADCIVVVYNAGFQIKDTVLSMTLEGLIETLNINVISSSMLNKIFIPLMPPGSSIVYLGSMLAERGVPGNSSYIISKHAVLGLMRATCQDLNGKHISTCCICPGLVETQLLHNSMDGDMIKYLLDNYIIGKRLIKPAEVAKVIYSCATSPAINGSIIPINFGIVAS